MAYDKNKLVKLAALEALARRTREKLDAAEAASGSIAASMYQQPTAAQYRTKGGMTAPEAGGMTAAALSELLDLSGLTPAEDGTYAFTLNGLLIGSYAADTKLSDVLSDINGSDAGVTVRYDETAGEFWFMAKETGADGRIELGEGLAQAMFDAPELSGGSAKFGEAYGVSWLDDNEVSFGLPGSTLKMKVSSTDTIEDVAEKLNQTISSAGLSASYNKYTGQLEVKDKNGASVDFDMWVDEPRLGGKIDLAIEEAYVPEVFYVPGQDGVFTAIKYNGQVLQPSGKAVDIGPSIAAAVADAGHLKRKKVASLDEIDLTAADAGQYIYMVPKSGSKNGDKYDEYMVLDGALEKVGSWAVDLSGYVQAEEGKGLSANDYTDEDKETVSALAFAADAEVEAMLDDVFGGEE